MIPAGEPGAHCRASSASPAGLRDREAPFSVAREGKDGASCEIEADGLADLFGRGVASADDPDASP